jgi:hypothetical protein
MPCERKPVPLIARLLTANHTAGSLEALRKQGAQEVILKLSDEPLLYKDRLAVLVSDHLIKDSIREAHDQSQLTQDNPKRFVSLAKGTTRSS